MSSLTVNGFTMTGVAEDVLTVAMGGLTVADGRVDSGWVDSGWVGCDMSDVADGNLCEIVISRQLSSADGCTVVTI